MHITVVSITNRRRWHLLEKTIQSALDGGAERAIVIDNESEENIAEHMSHAFPGRHRTVRIEPNQGSAGAYYYGIKAALEDGAEFLLLLDDDNVVKPGAIASLLRTYMAHSAEFPLDRLCVAGFRMEQELLRGHIKEPEFPSPRSFLGFHINQFPAALYKRTPWGRRPERQNTHLVPENPVRRSLAPWGGMFFHRSVIDRFGYPDPRFVLYCDDVEFTHRITAGGGAIFLDPRAEIDDVESSWLSSPHKLIYFEAWIERGTDEQVYFQTKNKAYLETHGLPRSWMRQVNRVLLTFMLWSFAVRSKKLPRFRLIMRAVQDGESGRFESRGEVTVIETPPSSNQGCR